jgi:hypothetical protein
MTHDLRTREAGHACRLDLPLGDRLEAGAEDFREIGGSIEAKTEYADRFRIQP